MAINLKFLKNHEKFTFCSNRKFFFAEVHRVMLRINEKFKVFSLWALQGLALGVVFFCKTFKQTTGTMIPLVYVGSIVI